MSAPLQYLSSAGDHAAPATGLIWFLLAVSILVVIAITALVWMGVSKRGVRYASGAHLAATPVERPKGAIAWIYWGVGVSAIPLIASLAWTIAVLSTLHATPASAFTVEVTAKQWWWQARYMNENDPSQIFTTANEIHIPTGKPVAVKLKSADVIHSFWVPALAGKIDVIPGRNNTTWIEADKPGRYRGQCQEYCGAQHAMMGFYIVADAPADFDKWRARQLSASPAPETQQQEKGERLFVYHCGACHTVRGTGAGGNAGPDLTHLASRETIAAASEPNEIGALRAWIENPHMAKPGTNMPAMRLEGSELTAISVYLETLE